MEFLIVLISVFLIIFVFTLLSQHGSIKFYMIIKDDVAKQKAHRYFGCEP